MRSRILLLASVGILLPALANAVPVRSIPGLESITFYERTGGVAPNAFTFAVAGPELTVRLADPLGGAANFDISGASTEYYDVFYISILVIFFKRYNIYHFILIKIIKCIHY